MGMAEAIDAVHWGLRWGVVAWNVAAVVAGLVLLALDERRLAGPAPRLAAGGFDPPGGGSPAL